ncbi:hypothetical protein [Pseudomonas sp. RIT-PI-AD]|uniref:hypothetical protein n=1 Tax=Pseudomonas sp. RIT-PI-AD TaxID=3035294 RepID=UPI0021D87803|nr:hypothetical protein [Pseudomonas sp. RIT-PI-AD]
MSLFPRQAVLFGAASFVLPLAHADYLWLERGSEPAAYAYLSEFQPGEHLPLAGLQAPKAALGTGKEVALQASSDAYTLQGPFPGDLRVTAKRSDGKRLTLYEAREGRDETRAANDLELVPVAPGSNQFRLHWKGSVVAASQVNVHTGAEWARVLKPAADGSVTLDTPFPGRYVLEVTAQVNGEATVDGQRYDSVVHVATLSFQVPK